MRTTRNKILLSTCVQYVQEAAQMQQMFFTASALLVTSPTIYSFPEIIHMPRFRLMPYMKNQRKVQGRGCNI